MPEWIGRWDGGRIAQGPEGPHYHLERMRDGRRYSIALGHLVLRDALAELALFERDPAAYARARSAKRRPLDEPGEVLVTPDRVLAFAAWLRERDNTEAHVRDVLRYLKAWTVALLAGRDLRSIRLEELHTALAGWSTAKQKRVVALKTFTAYLRFIGVLQKNNDPTLDLASVPSREPSARERAEKTYSVEQLEATYRHLRLQNYRDAFLIRAKTGMHLSEIQRVAHGECAIEIVEDGGEIAGVIVFEHKSKHDHRLSVDRQTLAACGRLRAYGTVGDLRSHDLREAMDAHNALHPQKTPLAPVMIAHLRHTFVTLAARRGRLVSPPAGGVPLDIIAQVVGHHATSTTRGHYLGDYVPPMIVLPITLHHPDDPPPTDPDAAP